MPLRECIQRELTKRQNFKSRFRLKYIAGNRVPVSSSPFFSLPRSLFSSLCRLPSPPWSPRYTPSYSTTLCHLRCAFFQSRNALTHMYVRCANISHARPSDEMDTRQRRREIGRKHTPESGTPLLFPSKSRRKYLFLSPPLTFSLSLFRHLAMYFRIHRVRPAFWQQTRRNVSKVRACVCFRVLFHVSVSFLSDDPRPQVSRMFTGRDDNLKLPCKESVQSVGPSLSLFSYFRVVRTAPDSFAVHKSNNGSTERAPRSLL